MAGLLWLRVGKLVTIRMRVLLALRTFLHLSLRTRDPATQEMVGRMMRLRLNTKIASGRLSITNRRTRSIRQRHPRHTPCDHRALHRLPLVTSWQSMQQLLLLVLLVAAMLATLNTIPRMRLENRHR